MKVFIYLGLFMRGFVGIFSYLSTDIWGAYVRQGKIPEGA
jgi:hypothetical protein